MIRMLLSVLPNKGKEVTNFAKGGILNASLCKIDYLPQRIFPVFLFEMKIFTVKFLEQLP